MAKLSGRTIVCLRRIRGARGPTARDARWLPQPEADADADAADAAAAAEATANGKGPAGRAMAAAGLGEQHLLPALPANGTPPRPPCNMPPRPWPPRGDATGTAGAPGVPDKKHCTPGVVTDQVGTPGVVAAEVGESKGADTWLPPPPAPPTPEVRHTCCCGCCLRPRGITNTAEACCVTIPGPGLGWRGVAKFAWECTLAGDNGERPGVGILLVATWAMGGGAVWYVQRGDIVGVAAAT